jgi:cyclophilin family peptidyl-prolyl cis-trans isomerase
MKSLKNFALAACAALLAACGGGGGVNESAVAVTATSVGTPMWGRSLLITLQGRNLDQPFNIGFSGCDGLTLVAAAPEASSATTAYLRCTPTVVGALQFTAVRPSDSVVLARLPVTVPEPQVTLTLDNGAGVAGTLVLSLEATKAPITVSNFLAYVASGFYVDTVIHRLVPGFIAQGGGYAKTLVPGGALPVLKPTNAPIALEDNAGLSNLRYSVAMARTNVLASATSQFFINLVDNTFLDRTATARGYATFGSVSSGTAFVDALAAAPCSAWPAFFGGGDVGACLPAPNLVVTSALQTR